jgi:hypothetical protein
MRGPIRWAQNRGEAPSPSLRSTSPRVAGRGEHTGSFSRRIRARVFADNHEKNQRGRRSAERRMPSIVRVHRQHCYRRHRRGRAPNGARSPSGASPRHSPPAPTPMAQPQAVFPGTRLCGAIRLRLSRLSALRADRSLCRPNGVQSRPRADCKSARGHRIPLRVQVCLENTTLK